LKRAPRVRCVAPKPWEQQSGGLLRSREESPLTSTNKEASREACFFVFVSARTQHRSTALAVDIISCLARTSFANTKRCYTCGVNDVVLRQTVPAAPYFRQGGQGSQPLSKRHKYFTKHKERMRPQECILSVFIPMTTRRTAVRFDLTFPATSSAKSFQSQKELVIRAGIDVV